MAWRTSWFDLVGRALPQGDEAAVARAIERMSAAFREGNDALGYDEPATRAGYLWHLLPAHVCDLTALLLDLADRWADRPSLRLLALGAGPGSEVLALGEAVCRRRERDEPVSLSTIEATRADRIRGWDAGFTRLLDAAREAWRTRDPDGAWTLVEADSLLWDVTATAPPAAVRAAAATADLVTFSNILTELPPRGTEELPAIAAAGLTELLAVAREGSTWLIVDRAGAPGALARIEALVALARNGPRPPLEVRGPRTREVRCACALTRRAKELYERVRLPTTKVEDRPVRNCHTAWCALCW